MSGAIEHVAVGVILSGDRHKVLVTKRHEGTHQGGLWEFPGGKFKDGEDIHAALARELWEEIGLFVDKTSPLIKIRHDYHEKLVLLDVWRIDEWHGRIHGREGQVIEWMDVDDLPGHSFPAADQAIIAAIRLPVLYQISPDPFDDVDLFITRTETCLKAGVRLFQLRCRDTARDGYMELVQRLRILFASYDATLLINAAPADAIALDVNGVHLNSARLLQLDRRPLSKDYWVAASCHNRQELQHASHIGADFVVLAPVNKTSSHPGREPIGWDSFRQWVENTTMPVYALGGMSIHDLDIARIAGGQGIAMLDGIWSATDPAALITACLSR